MSPTTSNTGRGGPVPRDAAVRAQGLHRTYGRGQTAFHAVRGVDLDVSVGEVFALLGTNGAGKTSTLELLEGLAAPDAGDIEVLGLHPLRDRRQLRPEVGIMLQSGGLPAELTVAETLEMWRGTRTHPTTVGDIMEQVSLTDRADVRVAALSGGQQRRLDLACALIGRPRMLFLDEPTTGLDPESRRDTWRMLSELNASGVSMVLTTHYLEEAEALADRIAIMHRGAIARSGTLRELVHDRPATIRFDDPGRPLPRIPGAQVDSNARVTITTPDLQHDLGELLAWAGHQDVRLEGLDARAATLESVFLELVDEPGTTTPSSTSTSSTPELIGAAS